MEASGTIGRAVNGTLFWRHILAPTLLPTHSVQREVRVIILAIFMRPRKRLPGTIGYVGPFNLRLGAPFAVLVSALQTVASTGLSFFVPCRACQSCPRHDL